jgi:hypothetical protein
MSTQSSLESTIIQRFIKPTLEFPELEPKARHLGYDITGSFHEDDFRKFKQQLFKKYIAPLILAYIDSEEAKQLDSRVSVLDITATFEPILEKYLRNICTLTPGRWDDYGPPDYSLWNWIASTYPFSKWITKA